MVSINGNKFQKMVLTSSVYKVVAYVFMEIISWHFQFTQNRIFAGYVEKHCTKALFQKSILQIFQSHPFNC